MPNFIVSQAMTQGAATVAPTASSDSSAVWSMYALIFNILLSVFNIFWFLRKRSNQRKYDLEFKFYELLVINSSKDLIEFSSKMKKELHSLVSRARNGTGFSKRVVEEHIERLDKTRLELRTNTIPLIKGYSLDLGNKIERLAEDCYDKATDIFSKFNRRSIPVDLENRLCGSFSILETQYIEFLFKHIKEHCPHC